ncbi:hypothetical protein GJ496_004662 [Pomphorhynchus laevis]|nr:hypothetical protein GJ496_005340 [Pomphorhynchus laevis]KAI0983645.1 hypothetical protein GJ496_004662 [Pomphorhynchus laevis]
MSTAVDGCQLKWQNVKVNRDFSDINSNDFQSRAENSQSFNSFYKTRASDATEYNTTACRAPVFLLSLEDSTVEKGGEKLLEVIVDGNPTPTVNWFKNGILIKPSDIEQVNNCFRIYIVEADDTDAGVYSVEAINEYGESKCYARLFLNTNMADSTNVLCPKFLKHFSDIHAAKGDNAVFEAIIYGNPKPNIQWLFNNKSIHNPRYHYSNAGDTYTLVVSNTCFDDDGKFTILAENANGKASCSARLFVSAEISQRHSDFVTDNILPNSQTGCHKKRSMQEDRNTNYQSRHYSLLRGSHEYGKRVHSEQETYRPLGYSIQSQDCYTDSGETGRFRQSLKSTKNEAKRQQALRISSDEEYLFSNNSTEELKRIHEVTRNVTERRYREQVEFSDEETARPYDTIQRYYKPVELIVGKRHGKRHRSKKERNRTVSCSSDKADVISKSVHQKRKRQIRLGSVPIGEHSRKVLSSDNYTSYQPVDIILNKPKIKKVLVEKQEEVDSKIDYREICDEQYLELSIPKSRHTSTFVKLPMGKTELSQFCIKGEHETKKIDEVVGMASEIELKIPKSKHSSKIYKQRKQMPVVHKISEPTVISGLESVRIHDKPLQIDEEISLRVQKKRGEHSSTIVRERGLDSRVIDVGKLRKMEGSHELRIVENDLEDYEETDVKIPKPKKISGAHSSTVVLRERVDNMDQIVNLQTPKRIPGEDTEKQIYGTISAEESVNVKLPKAESTHSTTVIHQQSKAQNLFELNASRSIPGDHEHKTLLIEPTATEVLLPKTAGKHTSTIIREKGQKLNLGRTRSVSGEHSYKLVEDSRNEYSSTVVVDGKEAKGQRYDIKLASEMSEFEEDDMESIQHRQGHVVSWLSDVQKKQDTLRSAAERGRHLTTIVKKQDDSELIEMIIPQPKDTSEIITQLPDYSNSQSIYLDGPTSLIEREIVHKDVKSEICANVARKYELSSELSARQDQQSSIKIDSGKMREEIVGVQMSASSAEVVAELKSQFEVKNDQITSIDNKSTVLMEVDSNQRYPEVELQMPMISIEPSRSVLFADIRPTLQGPTDALVTQDISTTEYIMEPSKRKPLYELNLARPDVEESTSTVLATVKGRLEAQSEVADYVQTEVSSSSVNFDTSSTHKPYQNVQVNIPGIEIDRSCSKVIAKLGAKLDTVDEQAKSMVQPKSSYSVCMSNVGEQLSNKQVDLHMRNIRIDDSKSEVLVNLPGQTRTEITGKAACDSSSSIKLDLSNKSMEITMIAPEQQSSSSTLKTQTKHHGLSTAEIKSFGGPSKLKSDQVELILHQPEHNYRYESIDEMRQYQVSGGSSTVIKTIGNDQDSADRYYLSDGDFSSSTVQVDVNNKNEYVEYMPKFVTELRDIIIEEGEQLILDCKVTAAERVMWLKDGYTPKHYCRFEFIDGILARLTIPHVSEDDRGIYTCIAISGVYQIQSSAYVNVESVTKTNQFVLNGSSPYSSDHSTFQTEHPLFKSSMRKQATRESDQINRKNKLQNLQREFKKIQRNEVQRTEMQRTEMQRTEMQGNEMQMNMVQNNLVGESQNATVVDPFQKFGARRLTKRLSFDQNQSVSLDASSISASNIKPDFLLTKSLEPSMTKSEGSFIRLEVNTSTQADKVEWSLNGKPLESDKNSRISVGNSAYSLVISNAAIEQAGVYTVNLFDHQGTKLSSTCSLQIREAPRRFQDISSDITEKIQEPTYTEIETDKSGSLSPVKVIDRGLKIRTSKSPKPETRITVRERSAENSVFTFSETEDGEFVSVSTNNE